MTIIIALVVIWWVYQLHSKVDRIQKELNALTGKQPASTTYTAAPKNEPQVAVASALGAPAQPVSSYIPQNQQLAQNAHSGGVVAWLQEDFFVKLGAFLLLIGFGWFVSYAFAHEWIGPMGRITLGLLTGVLIMMGGLWRIRSFVHQGSIFLVLGSSTVLLTVFAARELYDFFTPTTALAVMFLSVTFVALTSIVYKNEQLALASLILACVAPLFTNAPTPDIAGLFTYLLVVVLGTLWVVYKTGSHTLTFAALLLMMCYSLPFFGDRFEGGERDIALFFAFVFTALFFGTNVVSIIRQKMVGTEHAIKQAHLATALGTGVFLIAWILTAVPEALQSLVCVAWMLVFAIGSFVVYRFSENRLPFYIYSAVSCILLGVATAAELEGPVLTIAFTLEIGLLVLLTRILTRDVHMVIRSSVLFILPILLSLESITSNAWKKGFIHGDFFVLIVLAVMLMIISASLIKRNERGEEKSMDAALTFGVGGIVYFLIIIWLVLHAIFTNDIATMTALVVYSLIGLALFVQGRMKGEKTASVSGGLLLGFVVTHLFLIDIWQMELVGRIITFVAVGTLLISTAFIGQKKKHE